MKRNVVTAFAMLLLVFVYGVVLYADPGDETAVVSGATSNDSTVIQTDPTCPPPPDGYEGLWPPPGMFENSGSGTDTTSSTDSSDTSGIWPWEDPDQ
jgi:hypothetical protein